MFGIFRLFLSLLIVVVHLSSFRWRWTAWEAVFAFYALSGFLMTLVLNETYGFTRRGLGSFCANRFLRIYPAYYCVCAISAIHILALGSFDVISARIALPHSFWQAIASLTIIGQVGWYYGQMSLYSLAPNSWSLCIELCCYVILAVYAAKSKKNLILLALIGIITPVLSSIYYSDGYTKYNFQNHYGVVQAGFLPFAAGGLTWFYRDTLTRFCNRMPAWSVAALILINSAFGLHSELYRSLIGLYLSIPFAVITIIKLYHWKPGRRLAVYDKLCGELAYPVFICHWVVGSLVARYLLNKPYDALKHIPVYLLATMLVSWGIVIAIDRPVIQLRNRIRARISRLGEIKV